MGLFSLFKTREIRNISTKNEENMEKILKICNIKMGEIWLQSKNIGSEPYKSG